MQDATQAMNRPWPGRTKQCRTGPGRTAPGRLDQGSASQGRAGRGRGVSDRTRRATKSWSVPDRAGQDLAWSLRSAEPDRGGKDSVRECRTRLHDRLCQRRAWKDTGKVKAGLGRTWQGREGLILICQQDRGSHGRHRSVLWTGVLLVIGICGILRHQMLGLARSCSYLPRPIRTKTGPALSCLALHCLTMPSRHPCPLVQFC